VIRLALFLLALFLPGAALAVPMIPAMQCTVVAPSCGNTASQIPVARALNIKLIRTRIVRPHLINDGNVGTNFNLATAVYVTGDFDPIAAANAPDTTCSPTADYQIKVSSVSPFHVGDTITADFIDPSGTPPAICAINAPYIYVTKAPSYFISTKSLVSGIGNGNTLALQQAVGILMHLTVFNPSYAGTNVADGPLLAQNGSVCATGTPTFCDTLYTNAITYLNSLIAATGVGSDVYPYLMEPGNEENGGVSVNCGTNPTNTQLLTSGLSGLTSAQSACTTAQHVTLTMNGDWGDLGATTADLTMVYQIQKMRDLCTVAHSVGALCSDGGQEINGIESAYLDYLWNYCTAPSVLNCRQQADIFQQWGYNKSAGQAFNFSGNLVTSCQYPNTGPPGGYLPNHAQIVADRTEALLAEDANVGNTSTDLWDFHYYDVPGQGMSSAVAHFNATTGKPPMAGEAATYTYSQNDMIRFLGWAQHMGIRILAWWNQGGGTGRDSSLSGTYTCTTSPCAAVPITSQVGTVWNAYFTGQRPQTINGYPPPSPFCPP